MARSRKPKNKIVTPVKNAAFSSFDKACQVFFKKLKMLKQYNSLSKNEKRIMFAQRIIIRIPEAGKNVPIPSKELRKVGDSVQKKIRVCSFKSENQWFSPYELQLFWLLSELKTSRLISEKRRGELAIIFGHRDLSLESFASQFFLALVKIVMSLSSISTKYYSIEPRMAKIIKDKLEFEMLLKVYIHPARKKYVEINKVFRPAYAIGLPNLNLDIRWLKVESSLLAGKYLGKKDEVDVYIQSHALKRMTERLDLVNPDSMYYIIWSNTIDLDRFVFYKDLILYPIELHNCKVGYLVAEIIDDCLVFKTFLFVTHSSTPEGDKLKEISGLDWNDISYWKIDRLSTFINIDTEKYPKLTALFVEAGLGKIFELKEKELDIETLQDANLDGLRNYIKQGKEEIEEFV